MDKYYFAAFVPSSGQYAIFFPDFPPIASCGDSLAEAMKMAEDALRVTMTEPEWGGENAPMPSTYEQAKEIVMQRLKEIDATADGEILYQLIKAPDMDMTPVRVNISIPRNALNALDRKAEAAGTTRSGYIARIAMA